MQKKKITGTDITQREGGICEAKNGAEADELLQAGEDGH